MEEFKVGDKVQFKAGPRSKSLSNGEILEIGGKISIQIKGEETARRVFPSAIKNKQQ